MSEKNLAEGVTEKLDVILSKLITLDSKMEELKLMVKEIRDTVFHLETEIAPVQDKQKTLQGQCSHMKKPSECWIELQTVL